MPSALASDFRTLVGSDPGFSMFERGAQVWTRADVDALARKISRTAPFPGAIERRTDGRLVALRCPNGPHFVAALLSIWDLEASVLLLDYATPSRQAERLANGFGCLGTLTIHDAWAEPAAEGRPTWEWTSWSTAKSTKHAGDVVKLTSGSTGEPRGIVVREEALIADESALFSTMNLGQERILTTIPMSHSYGLSSIAVAALRRDFTIVQPPSDNPLSALNSLKQSRITFFPTVPAWLEALVELEGTSAPDLGSVQLVITAGAPLKVATAQAFYRKFGLKVRTFYGASECGGIAFDRTGDAGLSGALGEPVDGVRIQIEATEPTAGGGPEVNASEDPHHVGRVRVVSDAVACRYLSPIDGSANATSTGDQPVTEFADGSFLSGDLGTLDDGVLRLVGRIDDVINLKGKKLYPSEVERVLTSLDGVTDAFVFADQASLSDTLARGTVRLKALVATDGKTERADIAAHCRQWLTEHKRPRSITIVSDLPRTARGKLDRQAARELCRNSANAASQSTGTPQS